MATATTDTAQSDQSLSPEDQQAKDMAKTDQLLQLVGAMNQTVAPLPMTLPTQTTSIGAPPQPMGGGRWAPPSGVAPAAQPGVSAGVAPVEPPTMPVGATPPIINRGMQSSVGSPLVAPPPAPQGRMYMGPAMSPDQESAFMQTPAGTRQNLMPGQTPQAWDAATREGVTRAPSQEHLDYMKRYDAQKSIQQAIDNGMPTSQAIQVYGQGMFPTLGSSSTRPMTELQRNQQRLYQQRLDQQKERYDKADAAKSKSGKVEEVTHGGKPYTQVTQPNGMIVLRPVKDGVNAPVQSPATSGAKRKVGSFKIGDVLDGYRFNGGVETDRKNWEKI